VNLLQWYEPRRSLYPWRLHRSPYRVLVSEIMLQQTQAPRVARTFERFVGRFPDVASLARASLGDVLRAWGGLGYPRRARNLHAAAGEIVRRYGGVVPSDQVELRTLPGVGPYTAAAVAALAFGARVAAIDTNVARVVARVRLGDDGAPRADVASAAAEWVDRRDPGGWNEALMDLGRTVCRPAPRCDDCPLRSRCAFRRAGARSRSPRTTKGQPPFRGSMREVRGAVLRHLRARERSTLRRVSAETGHGHERVAQAVQALAAEGLLHAGPAALAGRASGGIRLPS
jgi:A/G-specific adenine glycosylase